jgi:hypothetical protein
MLARTAAVVLCLGVLSGAGVGAQSSLTDLNEAGWKALQSGNGERASALFAEALAIKPDEPVLLLGAGASAFAQRKHRDAMARLKRALELDPRLTPASRLLGQIAYQQGDVDLAIRTYEKALKYAPGDLQLANELSAWKQDSDVHHSFEERRYDRFRVMFEGRAEEALAAQATAVLNASFWRIADKLGEYPSDTVVTILYTEKQFRDITRAPEWSGGQYDGRIRIPVGGAAQKPELFERVLTHELTHAIVAGIAPQGVPAWMHEGLAQFRARQLTPPAKHGSTPCLHLCHRARINLRSPSSVYWLANQSPRIWHITSACRASPGWRSCRPTRSRRSHTRPTSSSRP